MSTLALFSVKAKAIPLLGENAAQNTATALTLYPDSDDKSLFYFMPNSSAIQVDPSSNEPMFGFTYWGLSSGGPIADAGAYLTFTAHLTSDKYQRDALNAFIASGKKVAALPLMESTIGLTSTNKNQPPLGLLFNELDFAAHAGMAEDDIGVNAVMTGIGAKVFKTAIDGNDLFKSDYCFKIQGLGPNFKGIITVDYARVYDDFQAHLSGGNWFTHASINDEVEKLRQTGAISILIQGGDAKMDEYVTSVAEGIVTRLFKSELQAAPTSTASTSTDWSFFSFTLTNTHREELKTEIWSMTKQDLVTREFCIPITLSGLKPFYNDVVKNADATPSHE